MAKLTLNDVTSSQNQTSLAATLNANFALIESALEKTLSRDGTTPNSMQEDIDLGGNRVYNLPYATGSTEPVTLGQLPWYLSDPIPTSSGINFLAQFGVSGEPGSGLPSEDVFTSAIETGGVVFIPSGTYQITSRVNATMASSCHLIFAPDAVIEVDSGITTQAFLIDCGEQYSLKVTGGTFDLSNVSIGTPPNYDKGTCWEIFDCPNYEFESGLYLTGSTYSEEKGDSAIVVLNSKGSIHDNKFVGWADTAIYVSGGSSTGTSDDGGPTLISRNIFEYCSTGISFKRRTNNLIISENSFLGCYVDIGAYEVGAGEIEPGDRATITGNRSRRASRCIELRGGYGETLVTGNVFEDYGYGLDDLPSVERVGISLLGSRNCLISNNIFTMRDLSGTSLHLGVSIANYTVPGGDAYTAGSNVGRGNVYRNIHRALYEGPDVDANRFLGEDFESDVSGASVFTTTNANSEFSGHAVWSGGSVTYRHYRSTLLQSL